MALSRYAQERVDEELKNLYMAYIAGYIHADGTSPKMFASWLKEYRPNLYDFYQENQHAYDWFDEASALARKVW